MERCKGASVIFAVLGLGRTGQDKQKGCSSEGRFRKKGFHVDSPFTEIELARKSGR
jgi:hypothetical protein